MTDTPKHTEPTDEQLRALWAHVTAFVTEQKISCPEAVYQCDRVILNAYEFIDGAAGIVGFFADNDDE